MNIKRRFTEQGTDVWTTVKWAQRSTRIANTDGSVVFEMNDAGVPEQWTQLATDIMVSKYFRKAGVPQVDDGGTPLLTKDGYHIDTRPLPLYPEAVYEACDRCHFGLYDPVGR